MKIIKFVFVLVLFSTASMQAAFTIKNGSIVDPNEVASMPIEDHFRIGLVALEHQDWEEAAQQFRIVTSTFRNTALGQESFYYLGIAYFNLDELDVANDAFSEYLKSANAPQYFTEAVTYKFAIANKFRAGAKKRFFGWKQLPKWAPGHSLALQIYDEVIAAMPSNDIAAQALYAKGIYLKDDRLFRESIDVFQQLIKRFPKHQLAPQSYLMISKIYFDQGKYEVHNPDILALAELNLNRFQKDFPRHELVEQVKQDYMTIKELQAKSLVQTGLFYERKGHPNASLVYYYNALYKFPDTRAARWSKARLELLTGTPIELPEQQSTQNFDEQIQPDELDITGN